MSQRIGETFDAISPADAEGHFVRVLKPHVEGLWRGAASPRMSDRLRVTLTRRTSTRLIHFARA